MGGLGLAGDVYKRQVDGHKVVLLKPLTYMNLSGDSIAPLAGFFKIPADHVIVLCDDLSLIHISDTDEYSSRSSVHLFLSVLYPLFVLQFHTVAV